MLWDAAGCTRAQGCPDITQLWAVLSAVPRPALLHSVSPLPGHSMPRVSPSASARGARGGSAWGSSSSLSWQRCQQWHRALPKWQICDSTGLIALAPMKWDLRLQSLELWQALPWLCFTRMNLVSCPASLWQPLPAAEPRWNQC